MFRVAVCDDERSVCTEIESIIISHSLVKSFRTEVEIFESGESLCDAIERGDFFHLIFLDIELVKINGIDVCEKIRNDYNNENVKVVYISSHPGYAMQLFESRPMNFLPKPLNVEKVISNFEKAMSLWEKDTIIFEYTSGRTTKWIKVKDIFYFESADKKIIMHTHDGNVSFYSKLSDVEQKVKDAGFLWVHKSYLVNYNYIKGVTYEKIELLDGSSLPVSKTFRASVREFILRRREELLYE